MMTMRMISLFVLVFLIAIVLSGCNSFQTVNTENGTGERDMMQDNTTTSGYEVNVGDSIDAIKSNNNNNIILEQHSCIAWMDSMGYNIACIAKDGVTIRAIVNFSENFELLRSIGVEPIIAINQEEWCGKKEADFISQYGSCHFDYGSGAYIPSYISENGIIYFLYVFEGKIKRISNLSLNGHNRQGEFVVVSGT